MLDTLTEREREVAMLVAKGLQNKQIARGLGITEATVKVHMKNIFQRSGVDKRAKLAVAVLKARQHEKEARWVATISDVSERTLTVGGHII